MAMAAFQDGHHAQSFPSFGSERTGAPVVSYCRIADREVRTREPVLEPDLVVVQDPTLLKMINVFSGLKPDGYAVLNSQKSFAELGLTDLVKNHPAGHVITVPATEIAKEHVGRPVPNAVLLGAVAALTGLIRLSSVTSAIRHRFHGQVGEGNVAAAAAAFELVTNRKSEKESVDAAAD